MLLKEEENIFSTRQHRQMRMMKRCFCKNQAGGRLDPNGSSRVSILVRDFQVYGGNIFTIRS